MIQTRIIVEKEKQNKHNCSARVEKEGKETKDKEKNRCMVNKRKQRKPTVVIRFTCFEWISHTKNDQRFEVKRKPERVRFDFPCSIMIQKPILWLEKPNHQLSFPLQTQFGLVHEEYEYECKWCCLGSALAAHTLTFLWSSLDWMHDFHEWRHHLRNFRWFFNQWVGSADGGS